MNNAITNFGQFHLALTGLANHPKIGVVPTIIDGGTAFGSIGEPLARVPSPVRVDFTRENTEGFELEGFARAHDDTVFLDELGYLKGTLGARMGELLPDDEFFGRPITEAQAARRDRIKDQVSSGYCVEEEEYVGPKFEAMTVEGVAKRLATKAYLEGGGYGHADLADALLTRRYALSAESAIEHMFSAAVLFANMRAPWALRLAESAFSHAAAGWNSWSQVTAIAGIKHCGRNCDVAAAMLYGFAADMRDAQAGGLEQDNPLRAASAETWLASVKNPEKGVNIGARIFFGMSEALRAGSYDIYVQLAATYVGTLTRSERFPDAAKYIVRANWALAEQVGEDEILADEAFWSSMVEDLGLASKHFRDKGEGEIADIAYQLEDAAFGMIPGA